MNIRIVLADDHKIVRDGLRTLIEYQENMEIVGEAEDGRATMDLVKRLDPNVVVMDIGMPGLNGVEATRQILEVYPEIKIVALSMHADHTSVTNMLNAGAMGYVEKNCAFEELAQAILAVMQNKRYLSSELRVLARKYFEDHGTGLGESPADVLTPRQREVLQLLAEGKSTNEIAAQLYISVKTVEVHRQNIRDKLNLHSLADLVKYAIRTGMTTLEG